MLFLRNIARILTFLRFQFCQLYEKFIHSLDIDYQSVGECLNLVNKIEDTVFIKMCAMIGKC